MTTRLYGGLLGSVFAFLLGVVVLVRGWGQLAAFVLGIGLTGLTNGDLPAWAVDQPWTLAFVIASIITETASGLALLSFVPLLYAHHVRHPGHIAALVTAIRCWVFGRSAYISLGVPIG